MHRFCQAPSLLHPEIKNCHIKSLFPATRQSAIFSQSLQPCQAFRLDSSSVCDGSQKNGGVAGKRFYWLARFPAGHEAARQVSSGRKCVAFPVAVHLIFRSAPFLLLMPVFYFRFFSQKSLPYRKQCVALRRWAGLVSNKKLFNRLLTFFCYIIYFIIFTNPDNNNKHLAFGSYQFVYDSNSFL